MAPVIELTDSPQMWWWSLAGALAFSFVFWYRYRPANGGLDVGGSQIGRDFVNVWTGAKLALEGKAATLFSISGFMAEMHRLLGAQQPLHNFSYPPSLLVLIAIFGLLPYFQSLAVWTVSGLAAFSAAVFASGHVKKRNVQTVLLLALCPAAIVNLVGGQNGFFTAALFLGGLYMSEKKPVLAGILIGMLTVKPQLGLLLPFVLLVRHNWRCFASAAVTTLLLVGVSLAIWGTDPWLGFWRETIPYQESLLAARKGFYVMGMPGIYANALLMTTPGLYDKLTWGLLHATAALYAFYSALSAVRREGITARTVLMLALATIIIPPYCFNYDMTMVAGALAVYLMTIKRLPLPAYALFGLLWMLPTAVIMMRLAGLPFSGFILIASLAAVHVVRFGGETETSAAA